MRIVIDDADEFLQNNQKFLSLKDAECECTGDGHIDPCERCEAHLLGQYTPGDIATLMTGIGGAIRQGLDPDRYRQAVLGRSDAEIVKALAHEPLLHSNHDEAERVFISVSRTEGSVRALQACWLAMYLLVMNREKAACLIAGADDLLRIRPVKGLRKRLQRFRRRVRKFDEICDGSRLLIAINDIRKELREPIIVKSDWWWYRYDECVYCTDNPDLSETEKAHVESCPDCRRILSALVRLRESPMTESEAARILKAIFDDDDCHEAVR